MADFSIKEKNEVSYVEINIEDETIRTESGAMHYMRGQIDMESAGPSLGGFFKSMLSGESIFRPTYTGTGKIVLEPSLANFHIISLDDESYILDRGAYFASDGSVEVDIHQNKMISGLFSGEGMFQTKVQGTGNVVVCSQGPVQEKVLNSERLVVDGDFAVARSESLQFSTQKATKSILGSLTSGEGLVTVLEGTGKVYFAPIPNQNSIFRTMVNSAITESINKRPKAK